MITTNYLPAQSIGRIAGPYIGGFCRWWYTPIENIASFPVISPTTQQLISEPILKDGATWFGPVNVPDKETGWQQETANSKAGIYFKQKVVAFVAGNTANSHINIGNLVRHRLCIVGKLRAGGFYIILGDDLAGLQLQTNETSGIGSMETPGTKLVFAMDTVENAPVLPTFAGENTTVPPNAVPPSIPSPPDEWFEPELIEFTDEVEIIIQYTEERLSKYGVFPSIEVWAWLDGVLEKIPAQIMVDAAPPNQTAFTIRIGGPLSGYIILSS